MAKHGLIGTWALVATEWRRADGRHANPFGRDAIGVLTCDAAGNMSAQVMRAERTPAAEGTPSGIDTAMSSASAGYIAYFGTYEVDGGVVAHRVVGATFPGWVGATHRRRFVLDGDRLTLSDDVSAADGIAVAASTMWRRLSA